MHAVLHNAAETTKLSQSNKMQEETNKHLQAQTRIPGQSLKTGRCYYFIKTNCHTEQESALQRLTENDEETFLFSVTVTMVTLDQFIM